MSVLSINGNAENYAGSSFLKTVKNLKNNVKPQIYTVEITEVSMKHNMQII